MRIVQVACNRGQQGMWGLLPAKIKIQLCRLSLCSLLFLLCSCEGHWEEVEKVTGYHGKARVNPFFAAERVLKELGHEAERNLYLSKMPAHNAVMFLSAEGGLSEGRTKQMLDWVEGGGHLIYCLGGTRSYNDYATGLELGMRVLNEVLVEEGDPLLRELGIQMQKWDPKNIQKALQKAGKQVDIKKDFKDEHNRKESQRPSKAEDDLNHLPINDQPAGKTLKKLGDLIEQVVNDQMAEFQLHWRGREYRLKLAGFLSMTINRQLKHDEFVIGDLKTAAALHLIRGGGRITVLTHARPFRNRWLGEHDHARWLSALVGEDDEHQVHFVAAATASFWSLLWDHGWMGIVTLAACIAFWLWRHMPRFGPMEKIELNETRHFASHLAALGQFFWRMRRSDVLVQTARESVWEKLRQHHSGLEVHTRQLSDTLALNIATRCDIPLQRVLNAFHMPAPNQAQQFIPLMRDLQTMRTKL
ncbi:MAG: DUF4350 domain-containing protein [Prosthecobacter sp.]